MAAAPGNSGGVVVGALVCGIECSGFKSRFILCFFSFSLVEIFLSSREPFQHGASIACYICPLRGWLQLLGLMMVRGALSAYRLPKYSIYIIYYNYRI